MNCTNLIHCFKRYPLPGVQSKCGRSTQYGYILHYTDSPVDWSTICVYLNVLMNSHFKNAFNRAANICNRMYVRYYIANASSTMCTTTVNWFSECLAIIHCRIFSVLLNL